MKVKGEYKRPSRFTYVFPTDFRYDVISLAPRPRVKPRPLRDVIALREKIKATPLDTQKAATA